MSAAVLTGALVVDGTGAPGRRADVTVAEGRIAAIDAPGTASGPSRPDPDGLALAPGFVDLHANSDLPPFAYPGGAHLERPGTHTQVTRNFWSGPPPPLRRGPTHFHHAA